jgi:hypothetical protein
MAFYYYSLNGQHYQIEADRYTQAPSGGGPVSGQCSALYTVTIRATEVSVFCSGGGELTAPNFVVSKSGIPGPLGAVISTPSGTGCGGGYGGVTFTVESEGGASEEIVAVTQTGFPNAIKWKSTVIHEVTYTLDSGQSTACDGDCVTRFYRGDTVIRSFPDCPVIEEDIRTPGCSECCRELLPLVRGISI